MKRPFVLRLKILNFVKSFIKKRIIKSLLNTNTLNKKNLFRKPPQNLLTKTKLCHRLTNGVDTTNIRIHLQNIIKVIL